ncbi:alpha-hydroxy acid oxidase [Solirubrobacter soli]|uniref:alpha-hydroxy acid oxidase n=1 Tax=Solirubrobacter soli TaxID=363832 RepID=UPI0003FE073C|nr:alpha-hydroxy acid oxidase [Solirubrobacter soli]
MSAFTTASELADAARAALPAELWDYVCGGAGTEATIRRNRAALDALLLRPRVGRDVSTRRTTTTFLGVELALPVMLAPIGTIGLFDESGAAGAARAAARAGTASFVSLLSTPDLETVAQTDAALFFQHYTRSDRGWTLEIIRRVEAAGYRGLTVTLDSAVDGVRERELRNRFDRGAAQARPNIAPGHDRRELQAQFTWAELGWIAEQTELPLIVKGVTDPDDAQLAVQAGARALIVSNHGGRQLDHQAGTIELLGPVVEAVGDRAEVVVDGGFERGTDAVKALALGARAVLIGKAACFALAAGGEDALAATLDRFRVEVDRTLALLGVTAPEEVTARHVRVSPAPWT